MNLPTTILRTLMGLKITKELAGFMRRAKLALGLLIATFVIMFLSLVIIAVYFAIQLFKMA